MNGGDFTVNGMVNVGMNMGDVYNGVKQLQSAFNGLKLPSNVASGMLKDFDKLKEVLGKLRDLSGKQTFSKGDLRSLDKLQSQANSLFNSISKSYEELNNKQIYLQADWSKITAAQSEIDKLKSDIQNKLSNTKISLSLDTGGTKAFGIEEIISSMEKGVRSSKVLSAAMQEVRNSLQTGDFSGISKAFADIESKAGTLKGAGTGLLDVFKQMGLITFEGPASNLAKTEQGVKLLHTAFAELTKQFPQSSTEIQNLAKQVDVLVAKKGQLEATGKANLAAEAEKGASAMRDYGNAADQAAQSTKKVAQSTVDAANQVKQLQQSTQYFFSLRNMINLFKRGIREAVDTVKELDKAMTETAVVVPEWDVGDMWAKLPEYTKNANELGAKVVDLYKATTLYYQQGLRGNEVMDVAAETMKMARIGGLEAADATDKMTAALRGFNMEISATSAQRVNDVYSNLAANTASNTEELGTAMQRTASIAASAGMSFEGTAAFLAQAIETTREPAENLGTAMKTIVARFTELKKNPLEISEVDGEEVSYNKVDTALQSIGVSLKDTNGQFRNLDQVFLDISQRWDSLTQTQQRYIATTAAGSRQQSRFIAMMSNYQRTTELMDFANNSEGASQEQFEKTLDSLEAKIAQLGNAWDKFLMGITDNHIIKGAVDILTDLIGGVNGLIDSLSLGVGPAKSFLSLMTAFVGLKMGGRIANSLIGGLGGLVDPTSGGFIAGMKGGAFGKGNPTLASQIYTPIVAAIHQAAGKAQGNGNPFMTQEQQRYTYFNDARKQLGMISKNGGTVNQVTSQFMGLSQQDQKTLVNSFRNTFDVAGKGILGSYTKFNYKNKVPQEYERWGLKNTVVQKATKAENAQIKAGLDATNKFLRNRVDAGRMSAETYFKTLKDPQLLQKALNSVNQHAGGQYNAAETFMQDMNKQVSERAGSMVENANKTLADRLEKGQINQQQYDKAYDKLNSQETKERIRLSAAQQLLKPGEEKVQLGPAQKALEGMGRFGAAASAAGMGLQSFGSILQQSANPAVSAFGSVISSIGGVLSGFGMLVSGLASALTPVVTAIGGLATAGLVAIPLLIGGLYAAQKINEKMIKQRAEEVTTNYKEDSKTHSDNITNLTNWQSELARLSKGVDKNGNNVNLESGDYQQYLEIVDGIAKINPEIVKGYNAQGHAIIDNNKALSETLDKEKELQQQVVKDYTSKDSMDAVVAARDLNKQNVSYGSSWRSVGKSHAKQSESTVGFAPQADMLAQAKQMAATLKKEGFDKGDFKELGIDLDALANGEKEAVLKLQNNFDNFVTHSRSLMQSAGDEISEESQKTFDKAVKSYNKASGQLDDIITPVYEQLSAKMSAEGVLDNIPEDMVTFYNQGLKNIASNADLGTDEMIQQSSELATKFADLTAKGTEYDKVMSDIAEAQEAFGEDLDTGAYEKAADSAVESLEKIKKGVDSTSSYGQALTEFLDNQIAQIRDFTEEGVVNVSEALNTMSDEITAAEGALESFKKVEEGSNFSTAAEGMKEIYSSITEKGDNGINKHAEGEGDQTYWAGAESLLGRDNLKKKSKEEVDKMLKAIEPMLKEGQEGFDAFYNRWISKQDELKEISGVKLFDENSESPGWLQEVDDNLNPDVYTEIANALDMSEDMLVSMLNKGRQFGALDFANLDQVREGLATSDSIIRGMNSDVKGKRNMYIKQEALNAEFSAAGINSVAKQEEYTKRLEKEQGIKVISDAAEIGIKEFKDMGIHSQESLIATLDATGQYTKDEIQKYAETYAKVDKKAAEFSKEDFDRQFKAHEATKDPVAGEQLKSLESIDTAVASIADTLRNQRITEGHLDAPKAKAAEKMLFGGKGNDTEAQQFWKGRNAEGDLISRKEYNQTKGSLDSFITETNEYISQLKEGQKNATTKEEKAKYKDEIERFEYMLERAQTYRKEGKTAYQETNNKKIAEVNKQANGLLEGKTWKDFQGEKGDILDTLYKASQEPISAVTDNLVTELHNADLRLKDAYEAGLVTDEAYEAYKQKAKENKKKKNAAEQQGEDEADKEDTQKKKGKKKEKKKEEADTETEDNKQEQEKEDKEKQKKQQEEAAKRAKIAADQRNRENTARLESAEETKRQQEEQQKQQQREAAEKARIAAAQRERENAAKLANTEKQGAFDQYTPEEAQKAGQNLRDWWNNIFKSFKMDTSKNALGFSSEDIDTSGLDNAAKSAENTANGAKAASDELEKNKNSITNVASAVTSGLNYANKGVKTFVQNAKEASSPSLQGKPKEKGTTIPGVGYVVNGKPTASPKKEGQSSVGDQTATLKVNADYTQVGEAKKAVNSTIKLTKKPAKLFVNATIGKNIGKAQEALNTLKQSSGQKVSSSVKVSSTGDTSGVKTITKAASSAKSSVLVTANTAPAYQKINALMSSINGKTANVDVNVWPHYKGTWKKEIYVSKTGPGAATGLNNTGTVPQLPNLGSLAGGTGRPGVGRIGPKGRGGLTLTGELGYEVAWLPREGRSMILGAKGPEMVNLPGDAVVWDHEQSKQIVKKNQIPSGSAAIGAGSAYTTGKGYTPKYTNNDNGNVYSGGKVTKSGTVNSSKKNNKSTEKILKQTWKLLNTAGKISNWWENISRRVEGAQRISDRNQKAFKKLIDTAGTTLKDVQASAKKYAASLQNTINLNQQIVNKYTKQLDKLDNGSGSTKQRNAQRKKINKASNKVTKAQAKVELAEKTKSKKDDKKAKKALKKAKKALKTAKKKNKKVDTVTYDDTILTTTIKKVNGKKKKVKSKEKVKSTRAVDWSSIIEYDAKNDTWVLNDKAINKQAGGNKNAAKAIKEKGNKLIDEKISRRNTAQDKIDAAKEALDQLAEDTYNMFNRWEKSLTETYLISKKLEALQKKSDIYDAQKEYITARTSAGYHTEESFDQLQKVLIDKQNNLVEQLHANVDNIEASFSAYQKSLDFQEYYDNFLIPNSKGINGESETANNDIKAATIVFDLMKEYGLNSVDTFDPGKIKELYKQYAENEYNNETDTAVQKVIDRIAENQENYLDAIQQSYGTLTEVYNTLNEYEEYINEFEESLLKGFEEEINKEIDKQEKLNSALTDAFKDLIDEVRRRLDQRREAEDNTRTESDISRKQQRLAVLRADTSGGHASEIKQLEQEITDAQQQYGRTLEDQLLNRLQEQGDEAAKQRERQIKLLEIQRDLAQALGTNLEEVKRLLENPEENYEQIRRLWLTNQGYDEALPEKQEQLERDWLNAWDEYRASGIASEELRKVLGSNELNLPADYQTAVQDGIKSIYDLLNAYINKGVPEVEVKTDSDFDLSTAKEKGINAETAYYLARQKDKNITYKDIKNAGYNAKDFKTAGIGADKALEAGFEHNELKKNGYGSVDYKASNIDYDIAKAAFTVDELAKADYEEAIQQKENDKFAKIQDDYKKFNYNHGENSKKNTSKQKGKLTGEQFKQQVARGVKLGYSIYQVASELAGTKALSWKTVLTAAKAAGYGAKTIKKWNPNAKKTSNFYKAFVSVFNEKTWKKYAQGGLATTTGPAWLDGTRAKPELILNATDTKNFIALKDVLSSVMNGVNSMTDVSDVQGAPVTYDININVDHLNNDYDVDRVADRVKKIIVQDASYRNVTAVRKFR